MALPAGWPLVLAIAATQGLACQLPPDRRSGRSVVVNWLPARYSRTRWGSTTSGRLQLVWVGRNADRREPRQPVGPG